MEVTGKIILALPPQSGVSKNGNNWHKREYVLETNESFPKKIHFDFFGDRADQFPLNVGDMIRLSFDIESREYNGRWFTSIRGWKSEPAQEGAPAQAPAAQNQAFPQGGFAASAQAPAAAPQAPMQGGFPTPPAPEAANDDLPF